MNRRNLLRTMLALPVVVVVAPAVAAVPSVDLDASKKFVEDGWKASREMADAWTREAHALIAEVEERGRITSQLAASSMAAINFGANIS